MEKKFIPKKASTETNEIKSILLSGNSIKIDGRGRIEVNGCKYGNVEKRSAYSAQCFYNAINELKEDDYIVEKCDCENSGCGQYHAVSYWLKGE